MREERSPEEVAGGYILVNWGEEKPRQLPTLKIRAERDWKYGLGETLNTYQIPFNVEGLRAGGQSAVEALAPLTQLPTEVMLDLVSSYDATGALGGRAYLEENTDSAQLYRVLRVILRVVFPFADDLADLLLEARKLMVLAAAASSGRLSSMNGQSPSGESDQIELKTSSTTSS
jgi:hypothetical protein